MSWEAEKREINKFLNSQNILDIRQGSEYDLISEYTRVPNILGF